MAHRVRFSFDPPIQLSDEADAEMTQRFVEQEFPSLAPGSTIRSFVDSFIGLAAAFEADPTFPMRYRVSVDCENGDGRVYHDEYVVDLQSHFNVMYVSRKSFTDLAKSVEELSNTFKKIERRLGSAEALDRPAAKRESL